MRRSRVGLAVVGLVCLLACGRGDGKQVGQLVGTVGVRPEALVFPRTFVGYPTEVELEIANNSRATRVATLSTGGAFSLVGDEMVELLAGEHKTVRVRFDPGAPGDATGAVRVVMRDSDLTVPIAASAKAPLVCTPSDGCHQASFNAEAGVCIERAVDDGKACSNRCVPSGTCRAGSCVGQEISCDDGNACTDDRCEPARGCVKYPHACPGPSAPCKVPVCDPKVGCGEVNAADGMGCGSFDCVTMHACRSGTCTAEPTPEGATCASSSPCQERGVCHSQKCEQPPPQTMGEAWSYAPGGDKTLDFPGVVDGAGNVYFSECDAAFSCDVVSLSRQGQLRWRKRVSSAQPAPDFARRPLVLSGEWVVSGLEQSRVRALKAADGAAGWTVDLRGTVCPPNTATGSLGTAKLVGLGGGRLAAVARGAACSAGEARSYVVGIEVADGSVKWHAAYDKELLGPVADKNGDLYFRTEVKAGPAQSSWQPALIALSRAGAERFRVPKPSLLTPAAVYWGGVYEGAREATRATDGTTAYSLPFSLLGAESPPLLAEGVGFAVGHPCDEGGCDAGALALFRFEIGSGKAAWTVPLGAAGGWKPEPILTSRGSLLFAQGSTLRETGPAGETLYSCQLPGSETYREPAALGSGNWTVLARDPLGKLHIRSFWVGVEPRDRGWISSGGSMFRDAAAR